MRHEETSPPCMPCCSCIVQITLLSSVNILSANMVMLWSCTSYAAMQCNAMQCTAMHCNELHCLPSLYCLRRFLQKVIMGDMILLRCPRPSVSSPLHCIALHCIALHCIALHCIALHCIALHCIALHCIALHCTLARSRHYFEVLP